MALLSWPPNKQERKPRTVCDNVHGTISIFSPLDSIWDTTEFQRLRELKQLGLAHTVYPSGTHNRFVHSLGTYWLAYKLVDSLRRGDPSLEITSADHLCVSVGALCHDLGHGPFSHMFDGAFREEMGGRMPKHEKISCELIRRIFKIDKVIRAFEPFLGHGDEFEENITFITELVSSKKFDQDGNWLPKGRPLEKAFLYDVVSNDNDSIDVDKWDYLVRDSVNTGVGIAFNRNSIDRLIENALVLYDPEMNFPRICYPWKAADTLLHIGQGRQQLHETLYQHKTVRAVEAMVIRALKLASPHLKFLGDDGQLYPLSMVTMNMGAFLKTDDSVLSQIKNSFGDELKEARRLVEAIEKRQIPQRLDEEPYDPSKADSLLSTNTGEDPPGGSRHGEVEKVVKKRIEEEMDAYGFNADDVILITRVIHRGMGRVDPMERVLIYDSNHNTQPRTACRDWLSLKASETSEIWALGVYVPRGKSGEEVDLIRQTFDQVLVENGLRSRSRMPSPVGTPVKDPVN